MKNFFMSFLATLAGFWVSLFLAFVAVFMLIFASALSSIKGPIVKIEDNSVLKLELSGKILDVSPKLDIVSLIRDGKPDYQMLSDITGSIVAAASDDRIKGIVIECKGVSAGLAQLTAIVDALEKFKTDAPDKWVYAYSDMYSQGDYYIASGADSLFINPIGQVDIHGLSATTLYFHKLLEKLGVEVQVVKVGTYKSAVEPYILDNMSAPAREQQQLYLDNIWQTVSSHIAKARKVDAEVVNSWADNFVFAKETSSYIPSKIVDALAYRHEFDRKIAKLINRKHPDDVNYVSTGDYAKAVDFNVVGNGKGAKIAVLYACGDITDNDGDGIVASEMVPLILKLAEDKKIDGLVMYVNSPGGSAFASEQIWEALQQYKSLSGNPYYVSMSDYAASGGYYISCGADRIFATPVTLTGSIGIFGLIPNAKNLLSDKLGINTSTVKTNANGNFPSLMEPMTDQQKAAMQGYVEQGYELFTSRCAQGRHIPQDSIKKIGEGRVWDGREALRLGLVDELGGLDDAVAAMARKLNVESYTVEYYPDKSTDWVESLIKATDNMKANAVSEELGEFAPLYRTIKRIKFISPLQTRMDFTEVSL